jgi:hypothetical protein
VSDRIATGLLLNITGHRAMALEQAISYLTILETAKTVAAE